MAVPIDFLSLALLGLFTAVFVLDSVGWSLPFVRPALAFCLLTFVPGALILTLLGFSPRYELRWVLYVVGVSLSTIMAVGLVINLLYPVIGIEKPLFPVPLLGTFGFIIIELAVAVEIVDPPGREVSLPRGITLEPTPLALLLLPALSILAVEHLNQGETNIPLLLVLGTVALVPLTVALGWIDDRFHPLAVWSLAIALLYHKSLWALYRFSGQGNIIDAWQLGRWTPQEHLIGATSTSLLPNVTFSSTYAHLGGIDIFTQLEVINPLLVSLIPMLMFVTFRRYVGSKEAFLGACILIFAHPFYFQLPAFGRAATPVFFLAFVTMTLTDSQLDPLSKRGLGLLFTAGLIVSHYGAAYMIMLTVLLTVPLLILFEYADALISHVREGSLIPDGGWVTIKQAVDTGTKSSRTGLFSPVYVMFYIVVTLAWYMNTHGGKKFVILFEHAESAIIDLFTERGGRGGTFNRLIKDYGSESIIYSKYVYLTIGILIAIGVFATYYRRFLVDNHAPGATDYETTSAHTGGFRFRDDHRMELDYPPTTDVSTFDDEYLAFATTLLGVFGLSFFSSGAWGGGRPMILTFCVISVFAVVGLRAIVQFLWTVGERYSSLLPASASNFSPTVGRSAIALILALMLVLNTGVAAVVVLDGFAPSKVPLQHRIAESDDPYIRYKIYQQTDIATYAWLANHGDPAPSIYQDWVTHPLMTDWYAPQVSVRTYGDYRTLTTKPKFDLRALRIAEGPRYVVLSGHNVVMDVYANGEEIEPMSEIEPTLARHQHIYTTGRSNIYFSNTTVRSENSPSITLSS